MDIFRAEEESLIVDIQAGIEEVRAERDASQPILTDCIDAHVTAARRDDPDNPCNQCRNWRDTVSENIGPSLIVTEIGQIVAAVQTDQGKAFMGKPVYNSLVLR